MAFRVRQDATELKEIDTLAVYYYAYRQGARRAVEAIMEARKVMGAMGKSGDGTSVALNLIGNLLPVAVAVCVVVRALYNLRGYIAGGLWITSGPGGTTIQLPFNLAMRVVRKRGWRLAEVEPVKPGRRVIHRLDALRILCYGDKED